MGFTLDQLLDETGVSDIAGSRGRMSKTAAPRENTFSKLAQRCRAAIGSDEPEGVPAAAQRELAEKTAAEVIIERTRAEIAAIDGGGQVKTASAPTAPAVDMRARFIKEALAKGHQPEAIAEWLEKNGGLLERAGRGLREARAAHGFEGAAKAVGKATGKAEKNFREWQDIARHYEGLGEGDRAGLISKMRRKLGDEATHSVLKDRKAYHGLGAFKDLAKAVPQAAGEAAGAAGHAAGGAGKALGVTLGGKSVGISGEQLKKLKGPAAMIGGGLLAGKALAGKGDGDKKKGVVIVNS